MFVASTRIDSDLLSVSLNVFWMFPSRKTVPKEFTERFPSVPISPGLGFTSTFTADDPSDSRKAPSVPAGTFIASALSVQKEDRGATPGTEVCCKSAVFPHWGSFWVTYLSPKNVPVVPPGPSHLAWPSGLSHNVLATT